MAGLSIKSLRDAIRRRKKSKRPIFSRRLATERLENRALLAGDLCLDGAAALSADLEAEGEGGVVRFRLETTDLAGNPISSVSLGQSFLLRAHAQDVRMSATGVFSAYMDVLYTNSFVSIDGAITPGPNYGNGLSGSTLMAGEVDEVGGFGGTIPIGGGEHLAFSIPFIATTVGQAQFVSNPADNSPFTNVFVYGDNTQIADMDIEYGAATLNITTSGLPFFEDFSDGVAEDFTVRSGAFTVENGRYKAQGAVGADSISTINPGASLPSSFKIESVVNPAPGANGYWANGFVIFDYQSPTNFKYAGTFVGRGTWVIGQRTAAGFIDAVAANDVITTNQDYNLLVTIDGNTASLNVNGAPKATHAFLDVLNDGSVGVATQNAVTRYDNVVISAIGGPGQTANAINDTASTTEGVSILIDVLDNDFDLDGDSIVIIDVSQPLHGAVLLNGDNTISYTPETGYFGSDTFTYTIEDDDGTDTATVTVIVHQQNDPPIAVDDEAQTQEDAAVMIGVLDNDSDLDEDTLSIASFTQGAHGAVANTGNNILTYIPDPNFFGSDTFTYEVTDGLGGTDTATVTVQVFGENDPPIAVDDFAGVDVDMSVDIDVLLNDVDVDGDSLAVTNFTQGLNGSVADSAGGVLTYTPDEGFIGTDTFMYEVDDSNDGVSTATVTVIVGGEDLVSFHLTTTNLSGAPVSQVTVGDSFLLNVFVEDISEEFFGPFAAYLDVLYDSGLVDVGGAFTFGPNFSNGTSGDTLTDGVINEVGGFGNSTPTGDGQHFVVSIPFTATAAGNAQFGGNPADGLPFHNVLLFGRDPAVPANQLDFGTASLLIEEPVIPESNFPYLEDFNDGQAQDFTVRSGAFVVQSGRYKSQGPIGADSISTVNPGDPLPANFTIKSVLNASPGAGGYWANGFVIFDYVSPTNFKYAGTFIGRGTWAIGQRTSTGFVDAAVKNDVVATGQNYNVEIKIEGSKATLLVNGVVKTSHTFIGTINDGSVGVATQNAVTFYDNVEIIDDTAPPVGTPPNAVNDTAVTTQGVAVVVNVTNNDNDGDGDPLNVTSVTQGANGGVVNNNNGTVTYTPNGGFTGTDTFTYTLSDNDGTDTATVTITVNPSGPVGTPPNAVNDTAATTQGVAVVVNVTNNDSDGDGDPLNVSAVTQGANGGVVNNNNGTVTYTPNGGFTGTDTFTYTLSDNDGTDTATVTITVNPAPSGGLPFFEDFSDGQAQAFTVRSGAFNVSGGRYVAQGPIGAESISTIDPGEPLPTDFTIESVMNAAAGAGGYWTNGFVIFDYVSPTNFKYAGTFVGRGTWAIGQRMASGFVDAVAAPDVIAANTDYNVEVRIEGSKATLLINGVQKVTHTFLGALNDGAVGMAAQNAVARYDNVSITDDTSPPVGTPPNAVNDTAVTTQGVAVVVNVTNNDNDGDGDPLNVSAVTQGANGGVVSNSNGTVTYTPNGGFTGTDTFTYTLSDNDGTDTATVTVTVNPPPSGGLPFFEDFNDGQAQAFTVRSGAFAVNANNYRAQGAVGADSISTINPGAPLPNDFSFEAIVNATAGSGGFWSNGFLIFDYVSPTNFKYAGTFVGRGTWSIGQRTSTGFVDVAVVNDVISTGVNYNLELKIEGSKATLLVNGVQKVSHTFIGAINDGSLGVATQNAVTRYDDVRIEAIDEVMGEFGG